MGFRKRMKKKVEKKYEPSCSHFAVIHAPHSRRTLRGKGGKETPDSREDWRTP